MSGFLEAGDILSAQFAFVNRDVKDNLFKKVKEEGL